VCASQPRPLRHASGARGPDAAGAGGPSTSPSDAALAGRRVLSHYQPIVKLATGGIEGVEALARIEEAGEFVGCAPLFDEAARSSSSLELEIECLRAHLAGADAAVRDGLLFVNVSPGVLTDPRFSPALRSAVADSGFPAHRVVIEITERAETDEHVRLLRECAQVREMGFQLAVDDVGAGASGLNRIVALRPDWIKLDRHTTFGIDHDVFRQGLLDAFLTFERLTGIRLIVEGVETEGQLDILARLGVRYVQGFGLARPGPAPVELPAHIAARVRSASEIANRRRRCTPDASVAGASAHPVATVDAGATLEAARAALAASPAAVGVLLVSGSRCVAWATRRQVTEAKGASDRAAVEIAAPISGGMDPVDPSAPVLDVLSQCAGYMDAEAQPPIIVRGPEGVQGVLPLRDVMLDARGVTEALSQRRAPLTGLLTRVECDRRLTELLLQAAEFEATFIDVAGFRAINERLGYDVGDIVLRLLGALVGQAGQPEQAGRFAGHLRDDRFLLIHESPGLDEALRRIVTDFEASAAGYLERLSSFSKRGQRLGLRAIRIGVAPGVFPTPYEIFEQSDRLRAVTGTPLGDHSRLIALSETDRWSVGASA